MPAWGSMDILKACGALNPGSNPGAGKKNDWINYRINNCCGGG